MPNTRKTSQTTNKNSTTINTDPAVIPTISIGANELNNNDYGNNNNNYNYYRNNNKNIIPLNNNKSGVLHCLPDIFTDIDLNNRNEINANYLMDDLYKPYLYGKFINQKKRYNIYF